MSKSFYLIVFVSVLLSIASFGAEYNYAELQTKTLDEMTAVVKKQQQKVQKYLNDDDQDSAVVALKSAARYVLSRPDRDDNMVSKVMAPIRSQLKELNVFEKAMGDVVEQAISGFKNMSSKPVDRGTSYYVLVNFLAEFRPDLKMNPKIRPIYEKIRNAKLKFDKKLKQDLDYRGMPRNLESPSDIAAKILKAEKPATQKTEESPDDLEPESESD